MMSRKIAAAVFTMIAASLFVSAAYAHAELKSAEPAAGTAATTPPQQIKIIFNENVISQFSGVELKDQTGRVVATGKAATDPANRRLLVVPVNEQLLPGEYKVEWHAAGEDTHRVKGSFSFSVAP
jgi:copper resistance protein C